MSDNAKIEFTKMRLRRMTRERDDFCLRLFEEKITVKNLKMQMETLRDEARAALAAARREGAEAMREAAAQLFDEEARALGAKLGTQDAERAVRIRSLPLPGKARCTCQWEAGDRPCPTHGENDE